MKRRHFEKGNWISSIFRHVRFFRCIMLVILLLVGCSGPQPKVYRVGVVCGADLFLPIIDGLKAKLIEFGYVEGKNISYDIHAFNDDPKGEHDAAEKLVAENVDLIVTMPTQPSVQAYKAIQGTDIPMIFSYAGIEATGLVESVSHPGGNTTGVRFPGPEQICRILELLRYFVPKAKRVLITYDKNYPTAIPSLQALRRLAGEMELELVELPVSNLVEMEAGLGKVVQQSNPGLDGVMLMPDTLNHSRGGWDTIRRFAERLRLPIGGSFVYTVGEGALYCNGNEMRVVGELTAPFVAKVLDGTPAGSIPVASPEQGLVVNLRVARELGIEVPAEVLNMANRIIR